MAGPDDPQADAEKDAGTPSEAGTERSEAGPPEAAAEAPPPKATPRAPARPSPARLAPARPEADASEGAAYMPKIPWGWLLSGLGLVVLFVIVYRVRDTQRVESLREELLDTHTRELGDLTTRYRTFRDRLERWTIAAAEAGEPERWVDPRLRIAGLHGDGSGNEGIYLRLHAEDATTLEGIEGSALSMETDALTRCLGIAPTSARSLYESGQFLMPAFVDGIEGEHDLMRLRLYDEQMANAIASDVPVLGTLMAAQYFLLVIQQGENRRDAPVDVYLWDLRTEQQLLRARIQGRGVLIPVRIDAMLPGVDMPPPPPGRPSTSSGAAHDCSIAAQLKGLTGEAPVSVGAGSAAILREAAEEAAGEGDEATEPAPTGEPEGGPTDEGSAPAGTGATPSEAPTPEPAPAVEPSAPVP